MTAKRHATDANDEAGRVHLTVQSMCEQSLLGIAPTSEELAALHRSLACVRYHAARTVYATSQFPAPDRRAPSVENLSDIPTPLAALEALLAECENTLDYRASYRYAMSNAHTAIVAAKKPRQVLQGSIVLGERIELGGDEDLTFGDLFGEPDPSAFNSTVLEIARAVAATDGAIAALGEVVHA